MWCCILIFVIPKSKEDALFTLRKNMPLPICCRAFSPTKRKLTNHSASVTHSNRSVQKLSMHQQLHIAEGSTDLKTKQKTLSTSGFFSPFFQRAGSKSRWTCTTLLHHHYAILAHLLSHHAKSRWECLVQSWISQKYPHIRFNPEKGPLSRLVWAYMAFKTVWGYD